jgi:hypothetical protein
MSIAKRLLPMSATVSHKTTAADGYGGKTVTWAVRHADYRCRIYQASNEEPLRLVSGEEARSTHKLLGEMRELRAGDRVSAGGVNYEVLGPDWPANQVYGAAQARQVEVYLRVV